MLSQVSETIASRQNAVVTCQVMNISRHDRKTCTVPLQQSTQPDVYPATTQLCKQTS